MVSLIILNHHPDQERQDTSRQGHQDYFRVAKKPPALLISLGALVVNY
jgi:hypothetical protein